MLALIVSGAIALIAGLLLYPSIGGGWAIFLSMLAFMGGQALIGWIVRKKVNRVTQTLQTVMLEAQKKVNRKVQEFQRRPQGNLKTMRQALEKDQREAVLQGLEITRQMDAFKKWNFFFGKQINTMRMQFYYQLREFDKVDSLIPKSMFLDASSLAMKMARQYANDDPGVEKTFKKAKKFKGDDAALLYGVYSWILVKQGKLDEAIKVLVEAKAVTDNDTLVKNWEHLVNGREKRFSNNGLGEQWYMLYLEEPKVKTKQQKHGQWAY